MILPRLQFITSDSSGAPLVDQARHALSVGVRWIQVRSKTLGNIELRRAVREIIELSRPYSAIVTINDRVDVAADCGADGVHLGRDDTPPFEAARHLSPSCFLGGSVNTPLDIDYYSTSNVAYCGIGPLRSSSTKSNLRALLGVERIIELAQALTLRMKIPAYAVGGISSEDVPALLSRGVYGIAASAAIHSRSHSDAQRFVELVASFAQSSTATHQEVIAP
jgi:thiamine-phosphate pyrophosphorylase